MGLNHTMVSIKTIIAMNDIWGGCGNDQAMYALGKCSWQMILGAKGK